MNLSGEWIGHYTGHFDEVVALTQTGDEVVARKVTGDDHVPAGEITWRANLAAEGEGEGQIAERDFRNPHFIPGRLEVVNAERIVFHWHGLGSVEYRRDD
jgi:hypothetical protein